MESHEQLKQKINELEEEIRLYKRFVEHISFRFHTLIMNSEK